MSILLKSALSEAIDALPETLKPQQLRPMLKKAGVKDEEIEMSGIGVLQPRLIDKAGRVAKQDLQAIDSMSRLDEFGLNEYRMGVSFGPSAQYSRILPRGVSAAGKNYRERVYSFTHPEGVILGSTHFPDTDYLMHTRVYDDLIGDQDTRVVAEIQSDLHQNKKNIRSIALNSDAPVRVQNALSWLGRPIEEQLKDYEPIFADLAAEGKPVTDKVAFVRSVGLENTRETLIDELNLPYSSASWLDDRLQAGTTAKELLSYAQLPDAGKTFAEYLDSIPRTLLDDETQFSVEARATMRRNLYNYGKSSLGPVPDDFAEQVLKARRDGVPGAELVAPYFKDKAAPWETSWARKGLENEIMTAIAEGKAQLSIPIREVRNYDYDKELVPALETARRVISQLPDPDVEDFTWEADDRAVQAILDSLPARLRDADDIREAVRDMVNIRYSDEQLAAGFARMAESNAADEGATTGAGNLGTMYRSSGVQKWYETYINPLAQKLAKQTNSDFKTEVKEGVEYATIKFGPETKADFKLYSAGGGLAAYMAYQQGYSEAEVSNYMRQQGFGEDEIAAANAQQAQIKAAKEAGYTDEEIAQFLEQQQPKPVKEGEAPVNPDGSPRKESMDLPTPEKQEAEAKLTSGQVLPADELLANLQVIRPDMSSVTTRIASFFGNQEAVNAARATEEAAINNIKELGRARGLEFDFDGEEWTMMTEAGPQVVTPGFLREMAAAKGELVGGIGGAVAGARTGAQIGGASPLGKAIGATVGGGLGGIIGAAAGTEFDYIYSSMQLQEEMSAEIAAHKALTAAEAAAYGEIVGLGLYKSGGLLWKGAVRAKDFLLDGNSEGARKALRETMFLTEDEISEVVERFEKLVDTKGMSKAQKEITAVATTLPGAEDLVRAASSIDSTASRSVVRGIDTRAKQLQAEIDKVGVDNTARVLKEDFRAYTDSVKQFYNDVKMRAAEAPRAKYWKFNFDKTAVMPVLENLTDNISSPQVREKFLLRLNQARKYAEGRTFADIIELRQVVNDFRFNNKIANAKDYKAIDEVIQSIDARIEAGAKFVFNKPQEWLDDFAQACAKYSQMKTLEKNSLVKLLNRPGVTPEMVSNSLLKYSNAIDGTYESVMAVLPKQMRELTEADMLKQLANKYTAGEAGGMNAVQFPMFAEDLASRSFVTEHGRQMKEAITQLADTFKNDVMLSKHSGMMQVPQFQSYLTADPVVRAKFEIASTIFNKIKQSIPGSKASREIALIKLTAEFLEKPLNAKTVGALKEAAKDTVGIDDAILSVQREQAEAIARNMDSSGVKIPVYGSGSILSSSGTGAAAMEIPAHRIASPAMVKSIADAEGLTVDSKAALDSALKRYGFKAVQYGSDKVRLLK